MTSQTSISPWQSIRKFGVGPSLQRWISTYTYLYKNYICCQNCPLSS